jgi:hypothetical protein
MRTAKTPICIHLDEEEMEKIKQAQKRDGGTFPMTVRRLVAMGLEYRKERE